jgi:hypothetical protein
MRPVRVIRGLGGNGSTFISRVIAAMENIVLLSETNPLSANLFSFMLNPVTQIAANYSHLNFPKYPGNQAELGSPNLFGKYINELNLSCDAINYNLVIRDYNYVDYIGVPFTWPTPYNSSLNAALDGLETKEIMFIRHPVSQFISLISHDELKNVLGYEDFLKGCRVMLEQHWGIHMIKYEEMFSEFEEKKATIAECLHLSMISDWKSRISSINWITGHESGKISVHPELKKDQINSELRNAFRKFEDYRVICQLCGYES